MWGNRPHISHPGIALVIEELHPKTRIDRRLVGIGERLPGHSDSG